MTDTESNNISLIEVLDRVDFKVKADFGPIPTEEQRVIPVPAEFVTMWSRDDPEQQEQGLARLLIISPSGEILHTIEFEPDLTEHQRHRQRGIFRGLPFVENGIYQYVVQVFDEAKREWGEVASVPLEIIGEILEEEL